MAARIGEAVERGALCWHVQRRRVLVVDDDPAVAFMLTESHESDGHVGRSPQRSSGTPVIRPR